MRIIAIQHDAADPPAAAGDAVLKLGHQLEIIRLDKGDAIPTAADADMMMTFGGGISFTQNELPAWVAEEQNLIRQYVQTGRRVLGICLGAQMIASALGAAVQRNREPEVGWHKVYPVSGRGSSIADLFLEPQRVFHWHQDTFGIPDGAQHILRSDACEHQGYVIDDRVVGLQFHLESTEKIVQTFMAVSRLWRQDARYVQTESEIIGGIAKYMDDQNHLLDRLIVKLVDNPALAY